MTLSRLTLASLLGLSGLLATAADAVAQQGGGPGYGGYGGWGSMHGWFFGPLSMLLYLGLLVAIVVIIVRWLGGASSASPAERSALEILKERFARGEIDKDEYEERRRVLND